MSSWRSKVVHVDRGDIQALERRCPDVEGDAALVRVAVRELRELGALARLADRQTAALAGTAEWVRVVGTLLKLIYLRKN